MAWGNVPICKDCWDRKCDREGQSGRIPVAVVKAEKEQCGYCGTGTRSGIYVRDKLEGVPFPPKKDD